MTEAEIKALQEKSALAVATAQLAEKTATEARTKAEADVRTGETRAKALETERDALTLANTTLTAEHTKAAADRDLATARAEKAEAGNVERDVEALVGKKIAPTEKDDFIKLRTDSPELFASMIAKRPDMKLTDVVIAKADPSGANGAQTPQLGADPGAAIWAKL